jgi:hypothetical protein
MVRSETDNDKGTAPPKPVRKVWTTGSILTTDKDFLEWLGRQPSTVRAPGTVYLMNLYVNQLNIECQMVYERQLKEHKERLHSTRPVDAVPAIEPGGSNVPEGMDSTTQNIVLDTPQNISSPNSQNISSPNSQNISSPNPQNISFPGSRNISNLFPQNSLSPSTPGLLSQNSPTLPPPGASSLPAVPAVPVIRSSDQEQVEQSAGAILNANRPTMEQALELFELMQARRSADVEKAHTVEAHHVDAAPRQAEPLSFMTL